LGTIDPHSESHDLENHLDSQFSKGKNEPQPREEDLETAKQEVPGGTDDQLPLPSRAFNSEVSQKPN